MVTDVRWNASRWKLHANFVKVREMTRVDSVETRGAICARRYVGNLLCNVSDFLVYPWSQSRRLALRYIGKDDIFDDVKHWVTKEKMESDELKRVAKDTFFSRNGSSVTSFTVDNTGFGNSVVTTFDQGNVIALPVTETFGRAGALWRSDESWGFRDILGSAQLQTTIPERAVKALSACFAGYGNLAVGHTDGVHRWDLNSNKAWPLFSLRKSITSVEKVSEHMYTLAGFDFPNWLYFFDARSPSTPLAKVPLAVSLDGSAVSDLRPFYHLQLHSTSSFTTIVACTLTGLCVLPIKLQASALDIYGVHVEDTRMYRQNFIRGFGGRANFQGATWHAATDSLWWYMDGDFLFCSQIELEGMHTKKLYAFGKPTPIPKNEITTKIYNWWKGKDNIAFPPASDKHLMQREDAIHMQETFTYLTDTGRSFSSELEQIEVPRNDIFEAAKILGLVRELPVLAEDLGYDQRVENILQSLGAWPLPQELFPVAHLPLRRHINLHELPHGPVPECLLPAGNDTFVLKDLDAPSSSDANVLRLQSGWGDEPPRKKRNVLELTHRVAEGAFITCGAPKCGVGSQVPAKRVIPSAEESVLLMQDGVSSMEGDADEGPQQSDARASFLDSFPPPTRNADGPANNDMAINSSSSSSLSSDGVDSSDDSLLEQNTPFSFRSRSQSRGVRPITSPVRHRGPMSSIGTCAASRTTQSTLIDGAPKRVRARTSSSLKEPIARTLTTTHLGSAVGASASSRSRAHSSSAVPGHPTPSASSTSPRLALHRRSRTPERNTHASPSSWSHCTTDDTHRKNGFRKKRTRSEKEAGRDVVAPLLLPTSASKRTEGLTAHDSGSAAWPVSRRGGERKKVRKVSEPSRSKNPKNPLKDAHTAAPRDNRIEKRISSSDAHSGAKPKKVRTSESSWRNKQPNENPKKSLKNVRVASPSGNRVETKISSVDAHRNAKPKKVRTPELSRSTKQHKEKAKKSSKDACSVPPRSSKGGKTARGRTKDGDRPSTTALKRVGRTSDASTRSRGVDLRIRDALKEKL